MMSAIRLPLLAAVASLPLFGMTGARADEPAQPPSLDFEELLGPLARPGTKFGDGPSGRATGEVPQDNAHRRHRDKNAASPAATPDVAIPGAERAAKGPPGMMGLPYPKSPDEVPETLESLYAFLATEPDKRQGGEIGAAIEKLWRFTGGDTVNLLIDRADNFSSKNETERGLPLADAAVDLAPEYAEAWSHRAYLHYRMQNYTAALSDLRRALALEPNHFRALDGMAKILVLLGEKKAALQAYEKLVLVHPNIEGGMEAMEALKKEVEGQGI